MGKENRRILVIEDDPKIMELICRRLADDGFEVDPARDGVEGFKSASLALSDAIILDIMLPGMNGIELLKNIRKQGVSTPVLILSAKRRVNDRVLGLQIGADDYLIKPFALEELSARIKSLLRRADGGQEPTILKASGFTLDLLGRHLFRGKDKIELKPQEFSLMEYLMRNSGRVVTRTQLLHHVWGYNFTPSTNVVEVHIFRLRGKIERAGRAQLLITVRGAGYMLVRNEEPASR